jgi:hypothetical protein
MAFEPIANTSYRVKLAYFGQPPEAWTVEDEESLPPSLRMA